MEKVGAEKINKHNSSESSLSEKSKKKLLSLLKSGPISSVEKKLEKKQQKLIQQYTDDGETILPELLEKLQKWVEKVNIYLDHGGKAYLFNFGNGEAFNHHIVKIIIKDDKKAILSYVYPHQYESTNIKQRNKNSLSEELDSKDILKVAIALPVYNINH